MVRRINPKGAIRCRVTGRLADNHRPRGRFSAVTRHEVRERARATQAWLAAHGLGDLTIEEFGLTDDALVWWHFERQGSHAPPDLAVYARSVGFEDDREFVRMIF